jgi:hypothetical protein
MERILPLGIIILFAIIISIGIFPGCDKLVTQETYFYDTIHDSTIIIYDSIIDTTIIYMDSSCVKCHSDNDNFMETAKQQWRNSDHSSRRLTDTTVSGYRTLICGPQCHTRDGFIAAVKSDTQMSVFPLEIGCYACHEPHSRRDFTVRDSSALTLVNGDIFDFNKSNLCARCHQSVAKKSDYVADSIVVKNDWLARIANHTSLEADILIGSGGYEFDTTDIVASSHAGVTGGCLDCHQTPSVGIVLGGHTCRIKNETGDLYQQACNRTGCHGSGTLAELTGAYIEELQNSRTDSLALLRQKLEDLSLVYPGTEIPRLNQTIPLADEAGALYNYFYLRNDKSRGMHNWKYDSLLIRRTLDYLDTE